MLLEFRMENGVFSVYADGEDQGWNFARLIACNEFKDPRTGKLHHVIVVGKGTPQKISVAFNGKAPNREDWFTIPSKPEIKATEFGVSLQCGPEEDNVVNFAWPTD